MTGDRRRTGDPTPATPGRWEAYARVTDLTRIRTFVTEGCRRAGASEEAAFRLTLATDEVVTNVLLHGYPARSGWIALALRSVGEGLELTVCDHAPAFDPTTVATAPVSGDPEILQEGGLGLHLVGRLVDRVGYHRADGTNRLLLTIDDARGA